MTFGEVIKQSRIRWIILIMICVNATSYGFNRYVLVPIQDQLIEWYNINDIQYNFLMTLYSWPNFIFCVLCGILIDRFGVRIILCLCWITIMIGLGLLLYSSVIREYFLLCIAEVLIGVGNEGFSLAVKLYVVTFFNRNEYGLVFGVYIAFLTLGNGLNGFIRYRAYESVGIIFSMSLSLIVTPIVCSPLFGLLCYDKFWFIESNERETKELIDNPTIESKNDSNKFRFNDIVKLNRHYWVLLGGSTFWRASTLAFVNISVSYFHHMFGFSYNLASTLILIRNIMMYTYKYIL